ncbi:REP-associated tyrosine transposase [Maritimibacter harenae]|nr:transposase [Maritimibacter harenae]
MTGVMSSYRRVSLSGGTFFFTVNLAERGSHLLVERIADLRTAYGAVQAELPFRTDAIVVMPDHIHAVWTLLDGDSDFSTRWKKIKTGFSKSILRSPATGGLAPTLRISASKREKGEVGIWQRRFWEHTICSPSDLAEHLRYCWTNPVKHGFVTDPADWPYSSFHRDLEVGWVQTHRM